MYSFSISIHIGAIMVPPKSYSRTVEGIIKYKIHAVKLHLVLAYRFPKFALTLTISKVVLIILFLI